jgi:hypothetical protein
MNCINFTWFQRWMIALTFAEAGEPETAVAWRDAAPKAC